MSETANKRYGCGIHTFWADRQSAAGFWRALEHACAQCDIAFAVIFFSGRAFDAGEIVHGMQTACPGVRYAACSTSGEITPQGMVYDNMVAVLFPAGPFRVSPTRIREITSRGMEAIVADVAEAKRAFLAPVEADAGPGPGHAAALPCALSTACRSPRNR